MTKPTEGDWECAFRVMKHCHPHDHNSAAAVVEHYRQSVVERLVADVREAYCTGSVAEWLLKQDAELLAARAPDKSSRPPKI